MYSFELERTNTKEKLERKKMLETDTQFSLFLVVACERLASNNEKKVINKIVSKNIRS